MSREIKFRAWVNGSGKPRMIEWGDIDAFEMVNDKLWHHNGKYTLLGNLILMQYTGLKDNNGKEIYEGDIVCGKPLIGWSDQSKIIGNVFFQESFGGWRILVQKYDCEILEYLSEITKDKRHELEVIGNIYENPELLKP